MIFHKADDTKPKRFTVNLQWCPIEMRISHRNERHQPAPILPLLPLFFSGKKEAR